MQTILTRIVRFSACVCSCVLACNIAIAENHRAHHINISKQNTRVYYIPFSAETCGIITPDYIAVKQFRQELNDSKLREIVSLLAGSSKSGRFDIRKTRLRIDTSGRQQAFLVDSDGNVKRLGSKKQFRVSVQDMKKVKALLNSNVQPDKLVLSRD